MLNFRGNDILRIIYLQGKGPIERPCKNGSIKHFLKNVEAKKEETGKHDLTDYNI